MDRFAAVCESIASYSGRLRKIEILADYLAILSDDEFFLAVQFLSAGPAPQEPAQTLFANEGKPKLSIGRSILRDALQEACGWDTETLRTCYAEAGDTGEVTGLLMRGLSIERPLALGQADAIYQELFHAGTTARRRELLVKAYREYRPAAIKYFLKVITRGLRIGLMGRMVEEAVAKACHVPHAAVREANNRLGDLARVALAARHGRLEAIEATLFHPMDFMLAKPLDRLEDIADATEWIIEDKYDGIRSQVHFDSSRVAIYSRGMEQITESFPDVAAAFQGFNGNGVVDGEILAWRDGRALSFNLLQQRIARKRVRTALLAEVPVVFMAYDLLLRNDELLFQQTFERRRAALEELPLSLSPQHSVTTNEKIDELFSEARARGNEGLLLKRRGSLYEPGRRSGAWTKLKRPYGTLDVVITAAEQGQGRRAIFLSDYTFGVRSPEGFVNVGKAYSGLTDSEVKELTRLLRAASSDRFGRVFLVRPEVVLEVAFDGVQRSPRHKSGYALRFPRIVRWRRDKKPEESDDLDRVKALYEASLG